MANDYMLLTEFFLDELPEEHPWHGNIKRLIDANALMENKTNLWDEALGYSDCVLVEDIENAPTVDAVEVVHGRWIPIIDEPTPLRKIPILSGYKCSVCGRYEEEEEPYCNCGAKMEGDGSNV